jgi:ribosomal protein S21
MKTVIEVNKNNNESNMSLIRRFTRKMQESGIVKKVKSKRYNQRAESKVKIKIGALKKISKKKEYERLFKLGKQVKSRYKKNK